LKWANNEPGGALKYNCELVVQQIRKDASNEGGYLPVMHFYLFHGMGKEMACMAG
jgi:hypothetical protein